MNTTFLRLNIAFKPPTEICKRAITLSKKIGKKYDTFFVLDGTTFYPHITIYGPEFPEHNIEKILKISGELANGINKFKFRAHGVGGSQGYMGVKFEYSEDVKNFHEKFVTKLNLLREEHKRKKDDDGSDYHMKLSLGQKNSIKEYGYPSSMKLYSPHLTISRLKDESLTEEVTESFNWDFPVFTVDRIAVYKSGEHGACRELIKEFPLSGNV